MTKVAFTVDPSFYSVCDNVVQIRTDSEPQHLHIVFDETIYFGLIKTIFTVSFCLAFLPKYIEHQYGLTGGVAAQLGTALLYTRSS